MTQNQNENDNGHVPQAKERTKLSLLPSQRFVAVAVGIILAVVLVIVIRALGPILKPLLVAVFFCILIAPIGRLLARIKIPRPVTYLLIFGVVILAGFFMAKLISFNVRAFSEELPVYEATIRDQIERMDEAVGQMEILKELGLDDVLVLRDIVSSGYLSVERIKKIAAKSIGSLVAIGGNVLVVLLLMIFIMLEADHFPARVAYAYGGARSKKILDVAATIVRDVLKYLSIKTVIAAVSGLLFTGFLGACGVEFFVLWGVSAFVLHFIPYIGSYAAVLLPTLMVLVQFSPEAALLMLGVLAAIQLLLGNYVEPRIMGRELKLSPLFIVMALAFWGWVWGIVGVFLAVPITATVKIVMENFSGTRGIARLMSDVTKSTLVTKRLRTKRPDGD